MLSRVKMVCGISALGISALVGCKGNDQPDARVLNKVDAMGGPVIDGGTTVDTGTPTVDAAKPDAAPQPNATGTVSLADVSVINPTFPTGFPPSGGSFLASFQNITIPKGAGNFISTGSTLNGCTAAMYDTGAGDTFPPSLDEGTIGVSIAPSNGEADAGVASVSFSCMFAGGQYICPVNQGKGITGTATMGVSTFTVTTGTFTSASVGHQLLDMSTGAVYPIVGFVNGTTVLVYGAPDATTINPYIELAAAGPIPFQTNGVSPSAPPAFLNGGESVTFALTSGGAGDFNTISSIPVSVGGPFTLDTATTTFITSKLPATTPSGNTSLGCSGAGGTCGNALGTVVSFTTTDTATTGATDMPAPTTKFVTGNCHAAGAGSVGLPPSIIDLLKKSGATRIEWVVLRVGFDPGETNTTGNPNTVQYIAGHGQISFVDNP